MNTFVLILMLWNGQGHPGTMTTAEFSSKATCEAAAKAASDTFGGFSLRAYAVCSPK